MSSKRSSTSSLQSAASRTGSSSASDLHQETINTQLLDALENGEDPEEIQRLLDAGANPNATCRVGLITACHTAALTSVEVLRLLIKAGAQPLRFDKEGRTPLHLAAYVGNTEHAAVLLEYPGDLQDEGACSLPTETEELGQQTSRRRLLDARCGLGESGTTLCRSWSDGTEHKCKEVTIPLFQAGWTALHVASSCGRAHCVRMLLKAGAAPNILDVEGRTALDVVGFAHYYSHDIWEEDLLEVIRTLIENGGTFHTMSVRAGALDNIATPLHTAVGVGSEAVFKALLDAGLSGSCVNGDGLTPLHLCVQKEMDELLQLATEYTTVEVRDREGRSVLRAAVDAEWLPGVLVALRAGADVTSTANDGETPIHAAAALGNLNILKAILPIAKNINAIDCRNSSAETPLVKAIKNGHKDSVNEILNHGADIKIMLPGDYSVLHVAIDEEEIEILKILLEHDDAKDIINAPTVIDKDRELYGFSPLHVAVLNKNKECVELLFKKGADVKFKLTGLNKPTALHIAAVINSAEIVESILKFDKTTIKETDGNGLLPMHSASKETRRDIITLLLKEGEDLSAYTDKPNDERRTAVDLIMNNVSKPTEFIEEIFDSYISSDGRDLEDRDCRIKVDYSVLMPAGREKEQVKVIEAILETGNRFKQHRLLVHPLVESFLYLKWKKLSPFFYVMFLINSLFLSSLNLFVVSTFYYFDTTANAECPPPLLDPRFWCLLSVLLFGLKFFQDYHLGIEHCFTHVETWVKLLCVIFVSLTLLLMPWIPYSICTRHMAAIAMLLSWLDMLCLVSRFPNWGYYVLMFGKVASNVVKILFTFLFLIMGFSLSFMILLRSAAAFDGPWPATVKTIVMMTSEFDYGNMFEDTNIDTIILLRITFLIFLIIAAVALMNLLTGVAVNDINELEEFGNIKRLAKQVTFIKTFDTLAYNKVFNTILPKMIQEAIKRRQTIPTVIKLRPRKHRPKYDLPTKLKNAIYDVAQKKLKDVENEQDKIIYKKKSNDKESKINKDNESVVDGEAEESQTADSRSENERSNTDLNALGEVVKEMDVQVKTLAEESKTSIEALNAKINRISNEMQMFLSVLQSRLDS